MRKLIAVMTVLLLGGCAGNVQVAENQTIPAVKPGQAQIVFMRSSQVNLLVGATLFDVTSGQPKLIGDMPNGTKMAVDLPPGEYTLMVRSFAMADFMKATVQPNKRYNVVLSAHWGAGFSMRPFKHRDGEFLYSSGKLAELLADTKLVRAVPAPIDEAERQKVSEVYRDNWARWQTKTAEQKAILTLRPEDAAN